MISIRRAWASVLVAAVFASGCTHLAGPRGVPNPSPSATSTALAASAYVCPTSDTAAAVRSRSGAASVRRAMPRRYARVEATAATDRLVVTYDRSVAAERFVSSASGASVVRDFDFAATGTRARIVAVAPERLPAVESALRAMPGVRSVERGGGRRFPLTVNARYYPPNDYFDGFVDTTPAGLTPPPAATYQTPPYSESADVPGQWEMHRIGLDFAFDYSQAGNGSAVGTVPGAQGSPTETIAIVDTGVDSTHPSLAGRIASEACFITDPSGKQSTSSFSLDPDGHGTDVAGIAAASLGTGPFLGAGGLAKILAYRVDPTPDDACASSTPSATPGPTCGADTADIASAIADATNKGARVISLSLGAGQCTNGNDPDAAEGAAIANAIAKGVIVVASSGNDPTAPVTAPACDTGVIAAGASALADGQPTGAGNSNGSAGGAATEYVASYTSTGGAASFRNASAWGIVAPGGDPSSNTDADDLHFIENIWTTTPVSQAFYAQYDTGDHTCPDPWVMAYTRYCNVLIAGTSMAAPQVAGAAALVLAATNDAQTYRSSRAMKQLLCSTADEIDDAREGCGRLNVYRAMATALHDSPLP